ncbi:hypothetical protein IE81DRAFT_339861 [Ceraceosorus guamensis]|uniref:Uncharacterized protein n=1 Tax=Ceraceosorus guamensis TaxID=1522189 RepID=A0A316W6E1_9BASI|nr:hypothetical protein IE81DRAFT_339861 [Ceraceosorus guamensis]PWN44668.1 hypothetical protein IE81DRAFT_339861 [Ceraceosorus guamensis]
MHALLHNVQQHPQEAEYRAFKSAQPKIHKEVLCVTGAKELLHLAGWNTRVRDFKEEWAFDEKFRPGTAAWSRLDLVVQCLDEHARNLEETAERIKSMQEREAQAEKSRKALAMSQAEEDRERVRRRVERERIAREAKAKSELAQREAGPTQSPSVSTVQRQSPERGSAQPAEEEATDAEDDYMEVPGHFSELSGGQRLGGKDGA